MSPASSSAPAWMCQVPRRWWVGAGSAYAALHAVVAWAMVRGGQPSLAWGLLGSVVGVVVGLRWLAVRVARRADEVSATAP